MSITFDEAKPRIPSQREQILNILRKAGNQGVTNTELQKVGIRWAARMQELYLMGYKIDNDTCLGNGVYLYILREEPEQVSLSKPEKAQTVLFDKIKETYGESVTLNQLDNLLKDQDLQIVRKSNNLKNKILNS